jgi:hypothetical protein
VINERLQKKEDYWGGLYMKLFTAAEKNESLAEVFKAECASMRSQLTSAAPTPHATPKKTSIREDNNV